MIIKDKGSLLTPEDLTRQRSPVTQVFLSQIESALSPRGKFTLFLCLLPLAFLVSQQTDKQANQPANKTTTPNNYVCSQLMRVRVLYTLEPPREAAWGARESLLVT